MVVEDELNHGVCFFQQILHTGHLAHSFQEKVGSMCRTATKEDVRELLLDDPPCRLVGICVICDHL